VCCLVKGNLARAAIQRFRMEGFVLSRMLPGDKPAL
jgi:hypothetical protein